MAAGLRSLLCTLALLGLAGCGPGSDRDARAAWLQTTLIADNLDLLERDPDLVAEKLAKMSTGPYAFFRATAGQFVRDQALVRFAPVEDDAGAASAAVMLIGDPHLENIGSFRSSDGRVTLDFNDFDAARFGPWHFDLRRLALAFYALALEDDGLSELVERTTSALAGGYAEEIAALDGGAPRSPIVRGSGAGAIVEDVFRRAQRDGAADAPLDEYAPERTALARGVIQPRLDQRFREDELADVSQEERSLIEHLLAGYSPELSAGVLDVARQLGQGVASYPLLRYLVLLAPENAGQLLFELKEERDAFDLRAPQFPPRAFEHNAERTIVIERRLSTANPDPLTGFAAAGAFSFRGRRVDGYQKSVRTARIEELLASGEFSTGDVVAFARTAGRLLAASHAGGTTAGGQPALPAIAAAIDGGSDALAAELDAFIAAYGPRFALDYQLYLELLDREGPRLGFRGR